MISELRLSQIIAVMTQLSEEKRIDLYRFLLELRNKSENVISQKDLDAINKVLCEIKCALSKKVNKEQGKGLSTNDFTTELRTRLINLKSNVQANWNTSDETDGSFIVNKPDLSNFVEKDGDKVLSDNNFSDEDKQKLDELSQHGTGENPVQSDWNESDDSKLSYIKNKPSIPNAQIQSDWEQSDNTQKDFIKNKPNVYTKQEVDSLLLQVSGGGNPVDLSGYEVKTNKVTSLTSQSTDLEYPSAKCVYDIVGNIESTLNAILGV